MAKKKVTTDNSEAGAQIAELREKLRTIKFAMAGSRPKNVKEERMIRRAIARLETQKSAARITK